MGNRLLFSYEMRIAKAQLFNSALARSDCAKKNTKHPHNAPEPTPKHRGHSY
jgi:hypothetical protein